jgi:HD-GYP domain-containing protein (c-di-GMP phosphodiesterase class II)
VSLDTYDTPDAQALLRAGEGRRARRLAARRELITQVGAALLFLAAAGSLAALAPWHRSLSPGRLLLVVATYVVVEKVRFPVAGGWTYPTMLVFVPALFMLPTPVVPLTAMVAILAGALPGYMRGGTPLTRLPADIADAWYSVGPVLVIVLAGGQRFGWSHWPVYLGALAAQVLFDMASTIGRCSIGEGVKPCVQLPLLSWVWVVDATLAPLGLVIASAAVDRPGLVLIGISSLVPLVMFARERQQRLDHTLALSTAYRGTALLLGDVVEADDHYTGMHSRDVVDLSLEVAEVLGLDATQLRNVEFAALLHDVGKIRIPKEIINKTDGLDASEWDLVRRHTIEGEKMLKQVGGTLASVGRIVRHSHERYDGAGYPDGLAGKQIPIESRIVCACDAFSAMTTNRSYRPALSSRDALIELHRCAGTQFDPDVVRAIDRLRRMQLAELHPPREQRPQRPRAVATPVERRERQIELVRTAVAFARARRRKPSEPQEILLGTGDLRQSGPVLR